MTAEREEGGGLGYLLVQAAHKWRNELAAALRDLDVTPPQLFVLMTLLRRAKRGEPLTQRELAQRTSTDANTTSQVVRALEARGLVVRAPHPTDSRAVALSLSDEGHALARECSVRVRGVNAHVFRRVDGAALAGQLRALLEG